MSAWEAIILSVQVGYLFVSLVFVVLTYLEGWHRREGWDLHRVAGLLLCFTWPLLIAAIALDIRNQRSQARNSFE